MEWVEKYNLLTDKEKEEFTRICNVLLSQSVLLQEKIDPKERTLEMNRDFRFLARYQPIFRGFLKLAGWTFELDSHYGVCYIQNIVGTNRYNLKKLTTYILCVLRLIYEEDREKLTLRKDVFTTLSSIYEKLSVFNLADKKKIPDTNWQESLNELRAFQVIERLNGAQIEPESRIVIYPTVLFLVTPEKLKQIIDRIAEINGMALDDEGIERDGDNETSQ